MQDTLLLLTSVALMPTVAASSTVGNTATVGNVSALMLASLHQRQKKHSPCEGGQKARQG